MISMIIMDITSNAFVILYSYLRAANGQLVASNIQEYEHSGMNGNVAKNIYCTQIPAQQI